MKTKSKWNLIVDTSMFIFLVPVFFGKGYLHQIFACVVGLLFITHILLHLKQINALFCAWIKNKSTRTVILVIFCVFTIALSFLSIKLSQRFEQRQKMLEKNSSIQRIQTSQTDLNP
ncbi:MAG: hypothetical protein KAH01_00870 [Caldisericia bacterium]|nr:hypothetical protein [Caldisericia bacterium]